MFLLNCVYFEMCPWLRNLVTSLFSWPSEHWTLPLANKVPLARCQLYPQQVYLMIAPLRLRKMELFYEWLLTDFGGYVGNNYTHDKLDFRRRWKGERTFLICSELNIAFGWKLLPTCLHRVWDSSSVAFFHSVSDNLMIYHILLA